MSRKTTLERFEAKFEPCPITGCWLWNASTYPYGYGRFHLDGKTQYAHRVSYQLYVGEIPAGLFVCHKCDVKWCVKPDHFFIGTSADNMRDKTSKGRGKVPAQYGEKNSMSKLTEGQALEIYQRVHAGERQTDLAAEYQIHQVTVSDIKRGYRWAHLTRESL